MQQTEINLKQAELTCWCHIAPFGEFSRIRRNADEETIITQLLDRPAYEQVVAAFKGPEVLVDFEHRAENTDDTTAAAWVQQLAIRDSGLWGLLKFTDIGAEAVRGRRLRFLSPVWHLDDAGRPIALKNVALTNVPYFKNLRPVLNKATTQNQPGEPTDGNPQPKEHTMKNIAALFGLPETASEAEILAAAKGQQEQLTALQKRIAELENAQLAAEAETVAEANKDRIQNKDGFVKLYVQNKEFAMNVLGTLAAPTATPAVTNANAAKLPSFAAAGSAAPVQNKYQMWRAMPEGAAKDDFLCTHADAINESAPQGE